MSEQDRYIPGVPCFADTTQPDPAAAAEFYGGLFGWQLEETMPEGSPGSYLMARLDGGVAAAISSSPEGAPPTATWNTYVLVESADATAAAVREAGGKVLAEPFDVFDSGQMATFADPEGAVFSVWQAGSFRGADVVNAPGSVNFNDLYVRDLERAKAFYGAVFGWDALPMGPAGGMWALRAYGDHLEQRNPGNRQGMKEMGAPERFEEVVASFNRDRRRQPGALEHHVRGRRRGRGRRARPRARRDGRGGAVRHAVGTPDGDHRPAGGHVHGEQVRAREPGRRTQPADSPATAA